jgi:large subunit ribosomal protein L5
MSDNLINPMKEISLFKVVINIGVGKAGEPLERAKSALSELTGHTPSVRGAKKKCSGFQYPQGRADRHHGNITQN